VTSKTEATKKNAEKNYHAKTNSLVEKLIDSASENLGVNYRSGGTTKKGFDCSGLMYVTFKNFDITLPRSSKDMAKIGTKINNNKIRKGDLIFFKTNGRSVINHVGMVVEVLPDEIKFIHSSTSRGVIISSTKEVYYGRSFAQANRIL
jgi:cell wall-associated NlpC family hydrolase